MLILSGETPVKKTIVFCIMLLCAVPAGAVDTFVGTVFSVNAAAGEIVVRYSNASVKTNAGDRLYLLSDGRRIGLVASFPMMSVVKCRLAAASKDELSLVKSGMQVFSSSGPAKPKIINTENDGAFLQAAKNGDAAQLSKYLESGTSVNAKGKDDMTALVLAIQYGRIKAARLLIVNGADVNARTSAGLTPLVSASSTGNDEIVEMLLSRGASLNAADRNGMTPLLEASRIGHDRIAAMLIRGGADVNAVNRGGETPLLLAAAGGHTSVAGMLLSSGAKVDAATSKGDTSLIIAADSGNAGLVKVLLSRKADVHHRNANGLSALTKAVLKQHAEAAALLRAAGAKED